MGLEVVTWAERKVRSPICSVAEYQAGLALTLSYEGEDEFILIMKELLQEDKVNALPEVQQYAPIVNYCRNSNIIQYAIWIVHKTDGLEVNLTNVTVDRLNNRKLDIPIKGITVTTSTYIGQAVVRRSGSAGMDFLHAEHGP